MARPNLWNTSSSEFEADADADADAHVAGFDEVLERLSAPLPVLGTQAHPLAVQALVDDGDMWLTQGDGTRHWCSGDRFTLQRDEPHADRYGKVGATFWVVRRN